MHSGRRWASGFGLGVGVGVVVLVIAVGASVVHLTAPAQLVNAAGPDATQVCATAMPTARQYGPITAVVAADRESVPTIIAWQEGRTPGGVAQPGLQALPAAEAATVCAYEGGPFPEPVPPPLPGATPYPEANGLGLIVFDDGTSLLDWMGPLTDSTPKTPAAWRASQP